MLYFRYDGLQVVEMKKSLKSAQHSGSVQVTFNVSKDVASHIRQSVVSSWKRMQDLGVLSVQLDKEQLIARENLGPCTELSKIRSTELQHYPNVSHVYNGYTQTEPVLDSCCRRSRGGKRSRFSGSRVTKRMRNDGSAHVYTMNELCNSTVSAVPAELEEGMYCKIGVNACRRFNQETASLSSSEHALSSSVQRLSSSQLPNHVSSDIIFGDTALNNVVSTKNPFVLQPTLDEMRSAATSNTAQSQDLPPPSTAFVPKRRKRRKRADNGSETVLANAPSFMAANYVDRTMLPVQVNGSIEATSNLCWQNCTNGRFQVQLNGHYPQQFNSPIFRQHAVSNARLVSLSCAGSDSPVALANYAQLPTERQMVLDSGLTASADIRFTPSATTGLDNIGISVKRNVTASTNQLLRHGLNVLYPSGNHCEHLHQPVVPGVPQSNSPSQLHDASSPLLTGRNLCSNINTSCSTVRIKPSETMSSLSFEVNSLALVPKSETVSSSSVDMIENTQCTSAVASAILTKSVCSSSKSVKFVVPTDLVDNSQPVSSPTVIEKHKSDVVNGCRFTSDCIPAEAWHTSHMLVLPSTVAQTVNKPDSCLSAVTNDTNNKYDFMPAEDQSSFTQPAPNNEANMHSCYELAECISSVENSQSVSG